MSGFRRAGWSFLVVALAAAPGAGGRAAAQEERGAVAISAAQATTSPVELQRFDALVAELERTGGLTLVARSPDRNLPRRIHESFQQHYRGVPVYGGGVTRQRAGGETVSVFGTIHEGIALDVAPRLSAAQALDRLVQRAGVSPATADLPILTIMPTWQGGYVLAYRATMRDRNTWFLDARSGAVLSRERVWREQAAVGSGVGILGDRKKLSVTRDRDDFLAHDRLRPAEIVTLDMRYSLQRTFELLDEEAGFWNADDVARDDNNDWRDPGVVDAHAHTGATYDYLALRQDWNGVDGDGGRILSMVNMAPIIANAFYAPPPFGPEKTGVFVYSTLPDGTPLVPLDVVAHELMHGVTFHALFRRTGSDLLPSLDIIPGPSSFEAMGGTFRCGEQYPAAFGDAPTPSAITFEFACAEGRLLLFADVGGAVNEAYSDIFAAAVEFDAAGPGGGDYLVGEDVGFVIRSLEDPGSIPLAPEPGAFPAYPDAVTGLVRFLVAVFEDGETIPWTYVTVDGETMLPISSPGYTAVHWNSTIIGHAFYLAIEGGANRTTGLAVAGVGPAHRLEVERVFFRALADLMPAQTNFAITAAVLRQSAVDLFGGGSRPHRAVDQALAAVGL